MNTRKHTCKHAQKSAVPGARKRVASLWKEDLEYARRLGEMTDAYPRQVLRDAVAFLYHIRVTVPRVTRAGTRGRTGDTDLSDYTTTKPMGDSARRVRLTLDPATVAELAELEGTTRLKRPQLLRLAMMRHWNWAEKVRSPKSRKNLVPAWALNDLTILGQLVYGGY